MVRQSILPRTTTGQVSRWYTIGRTRNDAQHCSWAENARHSPALASSRRSSSPTDTNHDPALSQDDKTADTFDSVPDTALEDETESEETESNKDVESRKGSVYLDASEGHPGLGDMLQDLREIPENPVAPLADLVAGSSSSATMEPSTSDSIAAPDMPSALFDEPPLTSNSPPSAYRASRAHARTLRHSFSSSTIPSGSGRDQVAPRISSLHRESDAEAIVELHEESAAAFQDFLFWAYPHLECKVSWTNVEPVSKGNLDQVGCRLIIALAGRSLDQIAGTGLTRYMLPLSPDSRLGQAHCGLGPSGGVRPRRSVQRSKPLRPRSA